MTEERLIKRLKTKTTTECLWPYILALLKEKPVYAYEIRQMLEEKFGFEVGQVTSYMVLYKLETDGYVKTEWRNVENRQRKYYTITDGGTKALNESVRYFQETLARLNC
ncbi:MAG: PadR family transcriptional regulator [Candidatus Altiarchaeota archaeon]